MKMRMGKLLLAGALVATAVVSAQTTPQWSGRSMDVAVAYSALDANVVGGSGFWMEGGSAQLHGQFWRGWGLVADVAGMHTGLMPRSTAGLDLITITGGPRYTWTTPGHRIALFGQGLAGEALGRNSVFPASATTKSSANSVAVQLGGGVNLPLSEHVSVRAVEADWLRTSLPNATTDAQNNLRIGAGIVFHTR